MYVGLDGAPNLVQRSKCHLCGENYLIRGRRYAQLIEMQDDLDIRIVKSPAGPQRTCFSFVPLAECIFVCLAPCWVENCDGELRRYAHAPLAGEVKGLSIG